MMTDRSKGIIYGCLSGITYGLNPLFALPLYQRGFDVDSVLFYRYAVGVILLAAMLFLQKQTFKLKKNEIIPIFSAGIFMTISSITLFRSYQEMDAGVASTILFTAPMFVAVLMTVFFKEKLNLITILSMVIAITGVALLCRDSSGKMLSLTGIILVIISALAYALYMVMNKVSPIRNLHPFALTFYSLCAGLPIYLCRLDFGKALRLPTPDIGWLGYVCILGIAIFPTVVALVTVSLSIRLIGATPTSILSALEPLTALCIGILVFNEDFSLRLVIGVILILTGVLLLVIKPKNKTTLPAEDTKE